MTAHSAPRLLVVTTVSATIRAFLTPYAAHFAARGWVVEAAARGAQSDPAVADAFHRVHDLPISRSLRDLSKNAKAMTTLEGIIGTGFDIVHVHTPIAGFLVRAASQRIPQAARPAVVYTAHGFHFHRNGKMLPNAFFRTAERVAGKWTDALIVINREDERSALRYRIVPTRRLIYMPGIGVDTSRFSRVAVPPQVTEEARASLGVGKQGPLVVMIAELIRRKRPDDLLRAAVRMRRSDSHILYLGDGPLRPELEAQAVALGIEDRVTFLGDVPDVRPYLTAATVLVLTSKHEGLPRSIMEALALEVPVVASDARGNPDLVGTDAGVIVPTGDIGAIARALDRVLDNPEERSAMGARGRARMVSTYDIQNLLTMHDTLYAQLLAPRPS